MKAVEKGFVFALIVTVQLSGFLTHLNAQGACNPEADSLVLVELFNSTSGPNWDDNSNWLEEGIPIEQWYGVVTNHEGCVTELVLSRNNLEGLLVESIKDLRWLEKLDLSINKLHGNLPAGIMNLPLIDTLSLRNNMLSDSLPRNYIVNSPMRYLSLGTNHFIGTIPPELSRFSSLEHLDLSYLWFIEGPFPVEIYEMVNLRTLSLSGLEFNPLQAEIVQLINLENLYLSNMRLFGVPPYIFDLSNLQVLELSGSNLLDFPWNLLPNVPQLQYLNLSNNYELSGEIGPGFYQLPELVYFNAERCDLSGTLSPDIGNLTNLEYFLVWDNNIGGQLPDEIGNLTNLKYLMLTSNQFEGPIPASIGNCTDLEFLHLSFNQFSGDLPPSLANLTNLETLSLFDNELTGSIPIEFANFIHSNLDRISLGNNDLSGCFPEELKVLCGNVVLGTLGNPRLPWTGNFSWFCAEIEQIGAFCNDGDSTTSNDIILEDCTCQGTPCIPTVDSLVLVEFFESTNGVNWTNNTHWLDTLMPISNWHGITTNSEGCVIEIQLEGNNLNGTLPDNFTNMIFLEDLNLANNQIQGPLPDSLLKLTELTDLNLSNNQFSGSVPLDFLQMNKLNRLFLNSNQLSELPDSNFHAPLLAVIQLNDNQFQGTIPPEFGIMSFLFDLRLSNNQFEGPIPPEFGQNENLWILWLENNQLEGPIPEELANCRDLFSLRLTNNQLSGGIPEFLGSLPLQQLFLQDNNFSGCIPDSLSNLCGTALVLLSGNPKLPWQGNFNQFCAGEDQIGAPCDDGNPETVNDSIGLDCICAGELITYNLNLLSLPVEGGQTEGSGSYPGGVDVNILAEAAAGYEFVHWIYESDEYLSDEYEFTFTMPFNDTTLYALFEEVFYELTLSSIPPEGGQTTGSGSYRGGEEVSILAEPSDNYRFVHWMNENEELFSEEPEFTFIMPYSDTAYFALFEEVTNLMELAEGNILIYPNPGSGEVTVEWMDNSRDFDITIYSVDGRILLNQTGKSGVKTQLDLPFPPGIYFIEISADNQAVWMERLVIK